MNFLSLTIIFSFVSFIQITSSPNHPEEEEKHIRAGFSNYLFKGVDKRDADAALKLWADELLKNFDSEFSPNTKIYESTKEIINDIKNNKIDLINLSLTEFFEIEKVVDLEPKLFASVNNQPGDNLFLVVQKESKITDVEMLKDKVIMIPDGIYESLIEIWISTLVNTKSKLLDQYFKKITRVNKPSQALLPVFFKQADACVITKNAFLTMIELNPQIKKDLVPISESVLIPPSIMCVSKKIDEVKEKKVIAAANSISSTFTGKQILSLFKSEGVINFDEKYLSGIRKMFLKYLEINK